MSIGETISSGIVFSVESDTRKTVVIELKEQGVKKLSKCKTVKQCFEALSLYPKALIVLDWENGHSDIVEVLASIQLNKSLVPPILLLAPSVAPEIVGTAYEYGVSQIHAGELSPEAIEQSLKALMRSYKESLGPDGVLTKVVEARSADDWGKATDLLETSWNSSSDNPRIAVELAENYIRRNLWEKAKDVLEMFMDDDPRYIRLRHLYARILLKQGRADAAVKLLEKAKILNPYNSERLVDLGDAFIQIDQIDKAKRYYGDALKIDNANSRAQTGVGKCALMEGDINAGLTLLKEITNPRELAAVFNTSAVLTVNSDRYDLGIQLYERGLAALGENDKVAARLVFNMGIGHKKFKQNSRAIACFEKAVSLDPSFKRAAVHYEAIANPETTPDELNEPKLDLSDELIDDSDLEEFSDLMDEDDE